jgi:hypothetical protein
VHPFARQDDFGDFGTTSSTAMTTFTSTSATWAIINMWHSMVSTLVKAYPH